MLRPAAAANLLVMFSSFLVRDITERAVATFAQTLVALIGTNAVDVLSVSITDSLAAAGIAAVLSILKGVAAAYGPVGDSSASAARLWEDEA